MLAFMNMTAFAKEVKSLLKNAFDFTAVLSAFFPLVLATSPAAAIPGQIGVVRSHDNSQQWPEIANRMRASGLNYCILEASNWQEEKDLQGISLLVLPNVASLNGLQVESLGKWLKRGGRAIVTGPTGTLAQQEVRDQLKSMLGAYWGYINSVPTTIRPAEGQSSWSNRAQLSSIIIGGVVIPAGINSKTEAIWLSDGKPPAVVVSDKVAFLGWRWGVDNVSSTPLDTAWLQASLIRLGISPNSILFSIKTEPRDCNPSRPSADDTAPILPNLN